MKITLDPGHGEKGNPYPPKPGYFEGTQMWRLAQYLTAELQQRGFEVVNTRPKITDDPSLSDRGSMAAKNGSAMFLSLHSNAPGSPDQTSVTGSEIFISLKGPQHKPLGETLLAAVCKEMNHVSRGVKTRASDSDPKTDWLGVIRAAANGGCTCAMLIEHGFHTNPKDAGYLTDDASLKRMAAAEAEAIAAYFKTQSSTATAAQTTTKPADATGAFKMGDIVQFTGGGVYVSSAAATPAHSRGASRCKVTQTASGKNPYHLVSEDGGGVYGWVGAVDIKAISSATTTPEPAPAAPSPDKAQLAEFLTMTAVNAAAWILEMVTPNAQSVGLFPSVKAAQLILESGYLKSGLVQAANNGFGMKKSLSGNAWAGSTWDGASVYTTETKEQKPDGTEYTITAEFRKYARIEDSIADHSAYLLGAKNGNALRYAGITSAKNYREQIQIIKDGGYATDTAYVQKVCDVIAKFGLDKYDAPLGKTPEETTVENAIADGLITDRAHWLGVLTGSVKPVPEYIKTVMDRAHSKINQ